MQIRLRELTLLPCLLMMVFALYVSISFVEIDMQTASYGMLALMLLGTLFSFFLIVRQRSITRIDLLVLFLLVLVAMSSFSNGTDGKQWVYGCLAICCLRFTFNYYRDNLTPLIVGLALGFTLAVAAQFYQLIAHPEIWIVADAKENTGYALGGNYNQVASRLLAALMLDIFCLRYSRYFWFLVIPCIVMCLSTPIMVGSMTAATSILLFLLFCLLPSSRLRRTGVLALFLFVALFQLFVCFNGKGIEDSSLAVWFIEDVLGKDITFTYRTHLWDAALRIIGESPLLGYGFPTRDWYYANMSSFAVGPHNFLIATLIYGGIIAFAIYLFLLGYSLLRVFRQSGYGADCILAGIAVLSLMMLMEVYPVAIVFTFLIMAEYYTELKVESSSAIEEEKPSEKYKMENEQ